MVRRERPGRSLAMDPQPLSLAVRLMFLELGDVMADVIHQVHLQFLPGPAEDRSEYLAGLLHEELTIAPGEVGGGAHGGNVFLPFGTVHRRAR